LMQKLRGLLTVIVFVSFALIVGCATQPMGEAPSFNAQPILLGQWIAKADHLYFILDASSSMAESYAGRMKFNVAKEIVGHFNETMPYLDVQAALRGFGLNPNLSNKGTILFYGPENYSHDGLSKGLNSLNQTGGPSPLAKALGAAGSDLQKSQGPVAMIIISDGKDMGNAELAAAKTLTDLMTGRLCLYTVLVGDDLAGKSLLEQIAANTKCGKFVNSDSLASGAGMAAFVQEVLLTKPPDSDGDGVPDANDRCPNTPRGVKVDTSGCPLDTDGDGVPDASDRCPNTPRGVKVDTSGCPLDTDGDGVYDYMDKCSGTPPNIKVDAQGCPIPVAAKRAEVTEAGTWIYKGIYFDLNKSTLKPSSFPVLDEIVAGLKDQPTLKVEIQGHTDSTGTADYNQKLSERRAQSVCNYLISKGIAEDRLISKGYGLDRPIASNKTTEGRARNRRVEFKPIQ
jgi:OOP family OmpA-OmpF porin